MKIKNSLIGLFLSVCIFCTGAGFNAPSANSLISEGDFDFSVSEGKATLVKYWQSESETVTGPSTVDGFEVVAIGKEAFRGAELKEVTLGEGINLIEERAFYVCENLTTVNLPSTLQKIEAMAFANCFELNFVKLPKSLNAIDVTAFSNCIGLKNLTVEEENPNFSAEDNVIYNKDKTELLICPNLSDRKTFTVLDSVSLVGERAFYGCSYITSVILSEGVCEIKSEAFEGCSKLINLTVDDGLELLGENAFIYENIKSLRFFSTKTKEKFAPLFPNATEIICLCKAEHLFDDDKDEDCNNCDFTRVVKLLPNDITSSVYKIENGYLSKIPLETTVDKLLAGINEREYLAVYSGNQKLSGDSVVGTGMTVKLLGGDKEIKSVTLVVTGDTNGDGKSNITDMLAVKSHLLKKTVLSKTALLGADTSGDGAVSITDFIQIKAFILKKGTINPN